MIKKLAIVGAVVASAAGYCSAGAGLEQLMTAGGSSARAPQAQVPVPDMSRAPERILPFQPIVLNEADSGKTVLLSIGGELRVIVSDPRDGGYVLQDPVYDRAKLTLVGRYQTPGQGPVGDRGKVEFRFTGKAEGMARVRITAKRPWENGKPGIVKFSATIEVRRLYSVMGRTAVDTDKSVPAGLANLQRAVAAAGVPALTDYGRSFSIRQYPGNTGVKAILADVTGNNESDIELSWFSRSSGDKAAKNFAAALRAEAKLEAEDADETESPKIIRSIADEAEKAFAGTRNFVSVKAYEHSIAEDGDLESHTLIGELPNGALYVLAFTNFPF
ncbi:MAG: protease inhibitor I42 family protein [Elusimicrobia bacterium]|nr:protease inhibitor I42 family protein [Elusimicrobiota bacterium]